MELLFNNFAQGEQCVLKKAEETGELEEKYPATQYRVYIFIQSFSLVQLRLTLTGLTDPLVANYIDLYRVMNSTLKCFKLNYHHYVQKGSRDRYNNECLWLSAKNSRGSVMIWGMDGSITQ